MKVSESQEPLIEQGVEDFSNVPITNDPLDRPLSSIEKTFLLHAERGDCATVRKIIHDYKDNREEFDVNCVDPLNRSALISAIENENIELIKLLLEANIAVKDALLHAIKEEYVEAVELLLNWEEDHHSPGELYSWERVDRASATFTSDVTPLILAARKNNYEIIKLLLDRGATLPLPHDVRCGCDECVSSSKLDSLRHSQARINAYRALSSPSLISLSSSDPILTSFELSWELKRLSKMETEFGEEYNDMRQQVQNFSTSLLDHVRTSEELEIMLNYDPEGVTWFTGERQTLERLKLAIKYKQKSFIAHPNVQQLLASIWYEGLPGFRRKSMVGQMLQVAKLGAMFPIYCTVYMIAPNSKMGSFMKKPFVKFICHSSSYAFFLTLLGAASQRVEILFLEWFGTSWVQDMVKEWKRRERGALFGIAECGVIMYIFGLIWGEIRSLWCDGLLEYISDLWNIVDFITNIFYVMWLSLRIASFYVTWRDEKLGKHTWYPREEWDSFEPMLLAEGAFAAGMIFSFLKLVHIFSVNPHLGPLQISLGRMIIDIVKFFFIYTLVLFAFGCGLNQLLWYYAELEKNKCYHLPSGLPDFDNNDKACTIWRRYANLFETSQSLFWASFGLVDLMAFELTGIKGFTRFWALLMFGSYSVINVIVLLNMLIAMMSNSYQIISERSDTEWKFARSRLWVNYFEDGDTLPPPFNLLPKPKTFLRPFGCCKEKIQTQSFKARSREKAREKYETTMKLLVRRFITAEQRKRDESGITEDDVMEIRQDISTLRYELIDILKNNGMKTPAITPQDVQISGKKGKVMERRLLKDFHIGIVEGIVHELTQHPTETKNVFGQIAKVIGRKTNLSKKKTDWNALVRKNTVARDPIGSAQELEHSKTRRQSLRKYILDNVKPPFGLDDAMLIEYNPKLVEVPKGARQAYAKFMSKKIETDYKESEVHETKRSKSIVTFEGSSPERSAGDSTDTSGASRDPVKSESADSFTAQDTAEICPPPVSEHSEDSNINKMTEEQVTSSTPHPPGSSVNPSSPDSQLDHTSSEEKCAESTHDQSKSPTHMNKTEEDTNKQSGEKREIQTKRNLSDKNNDHSVSTRPKLTRKTHRDWI